MNILKIFQKKNKNISNENSMCFILDKDNNLKIKLLFELNSALDAEHMADFLYELNCGLISQSIIDLMIDLGKENPHYQPFVKNAVMLWLQKITDDTKLNNQDSLHTPIVKPSNFTAHSSRN